MKHKRSPFYEAKDNYYIWYIEWLVVVIRVTAPNIIYSHFFRISLNKKSFTISLQLDLIFNELIINTVKICACLRWNTYMFFGKVVRVFWNSCTCFSGDDREADRDIWEMYNNLPCGIDPVKKALGTIIPWM